MSVRKRRWKTANGEVREAWLCDYTTQNGKRHVKTFKMKKAAEAYIPKAKVEVGEGTHTADSDSVTVSKAADVWLRTASARGLEASTLESYEAHVRIHIIPFLGNVKLSRLSAPEVRKFEDLLREAGRSTALIRKVMVSLGSLLAEAEERGLVARNVCRDLRSRRRKGTDRRADKRQKGRLKVPGRDEIKAIVDALQGRWRPILLTAISPGSAHQNFVGCAGPMWISKIMNSMSGSALIGIIRLVRRSQHLANVPCLLLRSWQIPCGS